MTVLTSTGREHHQRAGHPAAVPARTPAAYPYVLLSCGMSIDGYLDDASDERLLLSNEADFDRVDGVRAGCDAILVGAGTIRRDNPRLLVRSPARRGERMARGWPATPAKVTVTGTGDLDPGGQFFATGAADKLVYCASPALPRTRQRLAAAATVVVDAGEPVDLRWLLADLYARGVRRLMVEGGGTMHTQFLTAGLADELQLVIAPFFVGDARAPRFVQEGGFPWCPERRAALAEVRQLGDLVLLRYALSTRFGAGCEIAGDRAGPSGVGGPDVPSGPAGREGAAG